MHEFVAVRFLLKEKYDQSSSFMGIALKWTEVRVPMETDPTSGVSTSVQGKLTEAKELAWSSSSSKSKIEVGGQNFPQIRISPAVQSWGQIKKGRDRARSQGFPGRLS